MRDHGEFFAQTNDAFLSDAFTIRRHFANPTARTCLVFEQMIAGLPVTLVTEGSQAFTDSQNQRKSEPEIIFSVESYACLANCAEMRSILAHGAQWSRKIFARINVT